MIIDNTDFSLKLNFLEWDTEIIGIKSAYLEIIRKDNSNFLSLEPMLSEILQRAKLENYKFITAKINVMEIETVNLCLKNNGKLIDTELTFHKYPKNTQLLQRNIIYPPDISLKKVDIYWHEGLCALAETVQSSRYFIDKNIGESTAKKIWKESIYNSCNGRASYSVICFNKDNPVGLINVFEKNQISDIFLIAILPEYQGLGLGGTMLDFYDLNLNSSITEQIVETQLINFLAQKLYSKKGYNNLGAKYTIHFWI